MPIMGGYEALQFIKDSYKRLHHSNLIYGNLKDLNFLEADNLKKSYSFQNLGN